jgi:signal transduction histidine kinase
MRHLPVQSDDEQAGLLRIIEESICGETGEEFFRSLVLSLARAFGAVSAFACEFNPDRSIATMLAEFKIDRLVDAPLTFELAGTPCQLVLAGEIVSFTSSISDHYSYLNAMSAESYLAIPLKIRGGEVVGHLAVIDTRARHWRDIDFGVLRIFAARAAAEIERQRFERELETAKLAAEQANLAKSQFLAHMSHEIRTPLNAMFGYAQLMVRDPTLTDTQRESVQQITHAGEHLLGLVSEVLDIAKIEAGRIDLSPEAVDLEHAIAHVVAVARLRIEGQGLRFDYRPPAAWPPRLLIDEHKLRQILLNLLNNAAQFTAQGSVTLAIALDYDRAAQIYAVTFTIEDTGIGIADADRKLIFEPFYRTETGRPYRT